MQFETLNGGYPAEQTAYAARAGEILISRIGRTPKAAVVTFGCQQNVSDSQRIRGMLSLIGYELTDDLSSADFIVFNTCAVREHAEDRVYGNVGAIKKYKRENKNLILAVCGCMVQQETVQKKLKESYPYVDIVFGTQVSHRLPEFIYRRLTGAGRIFETELKNGEITEDVPVNRDGDIKGFVPIMYGCDNFCTYCIVPYVRGRERSRASAEILKEVRSMVAAGYKEIMLLGQNVNSYGKGLSEDINFAKLLRLVNAVEGDFRIRFMSSHPKDCTEELLIAMSECEKVERHLHLPVQSGSDRILGLMNRRYTAEKYLGLIKRARELMPDITFTSDIIVGFPGETYEDFKGTLELVKKAEYSSLFTFIYSPRTGTPAAAMEDKVSRAEKGKWFTELLKVQDGITKKKEKELIGKSFRVLCEEQAEDGLTLGKTAGVAAIKFPGSPDMPGKFITVRAERCENGFIYGTAEE